MDIAGYDKGSEQLLKPYDKFKNYKKGSLRSLFI